MNEDNDMDVPINAESYLKKKVSFNDIGKDGTKTNPIIMAAKVAISALTYTRQEYTSGGVGLSSTRASLAITEECEAEKVG